MLFLWLLLVFLNKYFVFSMNPKIECGYKQCPQTREGVLNIHLVPHSHMDAGWVKTFDEYYYGTKTSISSANVQLIYHSVLSELLHDKRRRFTFSETAYFWRWWRDQKPATRSTFRTLVQEGRVEFAGGGWVQNDEATTDYVQIIDQFTWGLRKLNDTLGPCGKPKAAWQVDTYGHTREQPSLLAQMGYDGLFIGRVDYKEREAMIDEDRMEFMWRGSDVLGKMSDIMTHTLFNLYNAPEGFCFDFLCGDEPIVDDTDSKVFNADKRVNDFISQIERQAKYYDHDNILVTMGGDFTYQSAASWFMNMDKLINYIISHPANISDINIFYSTPSCYLKAVYLYGRRDKAMYTEKADHLPYGSDISTYWTGFYSSRPSLKFLARKAHSFLQVVKQLTVIARSGDSYDLHLLRHAASLVTHHDAITGTSQQHVANDFVKSLSEAIEACTKKISNYLSYLTPTWGNSRRYKNNHQFMVCHQLNMTQCRFLETQESFLMIVYNPSSTKTFHHVRLPAVALHYSIRDYNDEELEYQILPLPTAIINLPGRSSSAIQELIFEAENIPPLGYLAYYVTPIHDQMEGNSYTKKDSQKNAEADQETLSYISNEYLKVSVNKDTGLLESIQHVDGMRVQISQNYFYYSQSQQGVQSGAYTFRPDEQRPTPVTQRVSYSLIRGSLVKEIRQRFNEWISQTIRLYRGEEFVEVEWVIGPVPIGTDLGKEVVTVFATNITNNGEFFTDSNGRQMVKRTCWDGSTMHQEKKSIAACYYPVTSRLCIRSLNTSVEMCVLPDRTQGGTSYNEGEMELMIHRRLLTDDGFGLEESLNEEAFGVGLVVRGRHRILIGNFRQEIDEMTFSERAAQAARRWKHEPWLFFTSGEKVNRRKWQNVRNKRFSSLRLHGLPRHVQILTLEPWKDGSVLLRLENTLEKSDRGKKEYRDTEELPRNSFQGGVVNVDLRKVFKMQVKMMRETTLAANQWLDDARQMDWSTRYVYSGGDDGILPEDVTVLDKDSIEPLKQNEPKEQEYSQEEMRPKQKPPKSKRTNKNIPETPYDLYDRRKRALNKENSVDNSSNDRNKPENCCNDTKEEGNRTVNKIDKERNIAEDKDDYTKDTRRDKTMKNTKRKAVVERGNGEYESRENASLRKRLKRKKKVNKIRLSATKSDNFDDGVTKSVYEMYYKSSEPYKQVNEPRKREKNIRRYRKNNEDCNSSETSTKRGNKYRRKQKYRLDVPDFDKKNNDGRRIDIAEVGNEDMTPDIPQSNIRGTKREPDFYQDYDDNENEEENNQERVYEDLNERRKKRNIHIEDADVSDQTEKDNEYVISLRPTQIRTFVVWFFVRNGRGKKN